MKYKVENKANDFSTEEIHITTKGRHTYAIKKQNGKIVARSKAKCHEDDKFDLNTGVNLCLERLGMLNSEATSEQEHYEVGDIVITDVYSELGECVVVKVDDKTKAIWVTPLGQDEYTKRITKKYIVNGFIKYTTAFCVNPKWSTVTKVE